MKSRIRSVGRLFKWLHGAVYDFVRFARYGGWSQDLKRDNIKSYYLAKVYHSLEKSMAFSEPNPGSGWSNAELLLQAIASNGGSDDTFRGEASKEVLAKFIKAYQAKFPDFAVPKQFDAVEMVDRPNKGHGIRNFSSAELGMGRLTNPEGFFLTRYSVREFGPRPVKREDILRALRLAAKAPSACNRQPFHTYVLNNDQKIQLALSCQTGNRGFAEKIQTLLLVCVDISAFNPGSERYQHWIDGGMFAMNLVSAFHALGIASCCLNWSATASQDRGLRRALPELRNSHTLIMMVAIGTYQPENKVPSSVREPIESKVTEI